MFSGLSIKAAVLSVGALVVTLFIGPHGVSWAQDPGEKVFKTTCFACHTIGGGRLVGPDLAGVNGRRSQEWLAKFILSSQSLIKGGDADAITLLEEYNGILMPDSILSEQQVKDVLSYIKTASSEVMAAGRDDATEAVQPVSEVAQPPSEEDILKGQELFQGSIRFENGGAACNSCHDVRNDAVIGGGILAAELTTVFSRMGRAGVKAILGQAPFPVMQVAYQDKSLTDEEVISMVAFLEYADSEEYNQLPRDYGIGLFISGVAGAAILFALFAFLWRGRKVGSVNQEIYDRQIKSVSDGQ
jgi:mono/diheme cytochrome c family protein